ncbi:Major Facilitator Superfamily (MFS) [Thraustotheca clavata]|uniref:Hexose transporter 1 n=1 Tax=Thraustotheca clavata TaxID=74557 RepID=A0A1V9ZJ50_9STRA|nr:Major Facilitator Superfamily (MFS) [Thraustotheca clavata]
MYWVDRIGRRRLLLLGGAGMVVGHLVSAISFTAGCHGNTEDSGCSKSAGWTMIVFTAFFIFNFAISWGPICWIYPAEIFPMNVRAKAVSASTMANWCTGAVMIGVPKLFPYLNINGTEGSRIYAIAVCVFASIGGMFFGYDQGVTGGVLVMDSFLKDFCVGYGGNTYAACTAQSVALPSNWLTYTTLYNVLYYVGCIGGAFVGGIIADKFGRRMTIFAAGVFFCLGTCVLVLLSTGHHNTSLIARFLQGLGVGNSSFSLPLFGAEMAPRELRGMLSGFMQMAVVTGIVLVGVINYNINHCAHGWRITNSIAMFFPIIVMVGIFFVPESPRWAYKAKGLAAAEYELQRLRKTKNVQDELERIVDAIDDEGRNKVYWSDLWHPSIRPRMFIAMMLQLLQQATGINPVFVYGGQIFQDVVHDGLLSLLILQIVNFLSTIPAMYLVDHIGRRTLLLLGAVGMVFGHIVSATAFTLGCDGNTKDMNCSKAAGWIMIASTAFFIFNFAISWGPICWIYPAEIFPLRVRAKAVSVSTMTNWTIGAIMIGIPKLFPYLNINGVFFLFGGLCSLAGVYVYFKCPETMGVFLEDIEMLFRGSTAVVGGTTSMSSPPFVLE